MTILQAFQSGGVTMYPLLLCSIIVWALFLEKIWMLLRFRRENRALYQETVKLLGGGRIEDARQLYISADAEIAAPNLIVLTEFRKSKELLEEKVGRKLQETQIYLRKYMWILGSIGATAPFIGLFGTIAGIMQSFQSIAQTGKSGFNVVAAGLAEALITTAAGIVVAIVSVIFYNYLQNKILNTQIEFKNRLENLIEIVKGKTQE